MDCVFFGTPSFSSRILERIARRHRVLAAVTQPDRSVGRGLSPQPSAVKTFCREAGILCLQPENARDPGLAVRIGALGAEAGIVVSYGGYLPRPLLESLPRGFINLHPSLLPRYRGAAPVNWAIIRGERATGLTVIRVTERMDAGPILHQEEVAFEDGETAGEFLERSAVPGAAALLLVLEGLAAGTVAEREQDESQATYAPKLRKEDGRIDWTAAAGSIVNLVRGTQPWPGAVTRHREALVKILKASRADAAGGPPGTLLRADAGCLTVAAGEGSVNLLLLQRGGGKVLPFAEFLRGARWQPGDQLLPVATLPAS